MSYNKDFYYEGPTKNQYEGWTDKEIEEDIKKLKKNAKNTKIGQKLIAENSESKVTSHG